MIRKAGIDLREILEIISSVIGLTAMAIIIWGVVVAVVGFLKSEIARNTPENNFKTRKEIRQNLGGYLLLGLEVLIAADIIETVANPTTQEVLILASIVVMRTFISYFLDKEIKELK
ncbi:DUF1622 domain-containing protein [Peptoclostridium acidaminophilum]|uniref:DUF1622 domain-containing protein n=1 Tax=Peptoclostridium acidaminophilum TaxID=1731 RepID=UPI0004AF76F1|nr:DUF1622 domain-containing protein [Peptoclostridium acidaminophilum]